MIGRVVTDLGFIHDLIAPGVWMSYSPGGDAMPHHATMLARLYAGRTDHAAILDDLARRTGGRVEIPSRS